MADEQLYGSGLQLDEGDLVFENSQLLLLSGTPNLLQALTIRVLTPFGSDMFNTGYGLDLSRVFSQPGTVRLVKELIKLNLVRTLSSDARVREIRDVVFPGDEPPLEDVARGERLRRFWRVEVLIDTVQDETVALATDIVV